MVSFVFGKTVNFNFFELFKSVSPEDKSRVRERLVQLFDVVGATDPRTVKARAELTTAIF